MRITRVLVPAILSIGIATIASAQASRTWVSGVGDDVNPCSRTAPCKTWAGAISKTAAGGEIDALDPAGYGAVTITKAIILDGTGNFASTLVSGTNGIVVQAGAPDSVILRRISINGIGSGINGVRFLSGKSLSIDGCIIDNFTTRGVDASPGGSGTVFLAVRDTFITNTAGDGIGISPSGPTVAASIDHVRQNLSNTAGLNAVNNCKVSVQDSDFGQNAAGSGISAQQSTVEVNAADTMLTNSAFGVFSGVGGNAPVIRLVRCTITGNTTSGASINAPATVIGFQSNMIEGNAGNNTITTHTAQ
jgi:hypothetical protein